MFSPCLVILREFFPPPPVVGLRFKLYKNKGFFFAEKKIFVFLSIATARRRRAAQQLARARARARAEISPVA